MRRIICGVIAVLAFTVAPASAADVTVNFGLSAVTYLPTGALCPVQVAEGADGVAVLDAAVEAGCILSYSTTDFGEFGEFVECINEICGQFIAEASAGTFWSFSVDGEPSMSGVSFYEASDGSEVVFTYEPFTF